MSKSFKSFLVLISLLIFNFSAAAYGLQFADTSRTVRLRWKKNKIAIAVSTSLSQNSALATQNDVEGAIRRSLQAWENVTDLSFELTSTDKQTISPAGSYGDGVSLITIAQTPENLILFGNATDEISAQTRTFYNRQGFISEADIVLNPYQQFSTDGTIGTYDLEATLTHEIGHLLGLEHSSVLGATMQERQGKNGVYNLSAFASRTLAEDDVTGIRALYGAKTSEANCCGTVVGKLVQTKSKPAKKLQVWAEEADSGRVVSSVTASADGSFRFEELKTGIYRVFAQEDDKNNVTSAQELSSLEVVKDKTLTISKRVKAIEKNFNIWYAGLNGQISDLAVPLNSGKSYRLYIGGKNINTENLKIGFNSAYLSVTPNSIIEHDYGTDVSVISFEVKVASNTPIGEYSLFVQSQDDWKRFLVGGITIENFINPWSSYVLPDNFKD